jgi:hypothetical protein
MASAEAKEKLVALLDELSKAHTLPRLSKAANDVDRIIELLSDARDHIARGGPPTLSATCMKTLSY